MLHDDGDLLGDGALVAADELLEQRLRLAAVELGIVLHLLQERPILVVGRVVLEHIEDELLLNRLAHGVEAERLVRAIRLLGAELL